MLQSTENTSYEVIQGEIEILRSRNEELLKDRQQLTEGQATFNQDLLKETSLRRQLQDRCSKLDRELREKDEIVNQVGSNLFTFYL